MSAESLSTAGRFTFLLQSLAAEALNLSPDRRDTFIDERRRIFYEEARASGIKDAAAIADKLAAILRDMVVARISG